PTTSSTPPGRTGSASPPPDRRSRSPDRSGTGSSPRPATPCPDPAASAGDHSLVLTGRRSRYGTRTLRHQQATAPAAVRSRSAAGLRTPPPGRRRRDGGRAGGRGRAVRWATWRLLGRGYG